MSNLVTPLRGLLAASVLLAACASSGGGGGGESSHPLARKPAPDVEVRMEKGGAFRPKDDHGKVLVLDFWATWCGPCKASFPRIDAIYKKLGPKGLEVVAINEDEDTKGVDAFVKDTGVTFPIAFDKAGKAAESFGVETMPSSFVIDKRGVVRFAHSGYHPDEAAKIEAEINQLLDE